MVRARIFLHRSTFLQNSVSIFLDIVELTVFVLKYAGCYAGLWIWEEQTRNSGMEYKNFIPFVAMVFWMEALFHGVGGGSPRALAKFENFTKNCKENFQILWKILKNHQIFSTAFQTVSLFFRNQIENRKNSTECWWLGGEVPENLLRFWKALGKPVKSNIIFKQ